MPPVYLLIMAVLAALCLYFAKRKNNDDGNISETSMSDAERVIRVYDIEEAHLNAAIEKFINLYSDNGDIERPTVTKDRGNYRLTFSSALNYISICYWVNYLVYSDESNKWRYTVRGWYPFGEVSIKGEKLPFCNQTVMIYVDKNDRDGDNVSVVTPEGSHYIQPFAIGGNLKPDTNSKELYCHQ